ncbi:hypothetical protein OBBRIDRAFT_751376 [Obba rivulosa]|uniref:F-box domain-containing protein n=1 Tax=Obba rivulosa TaxID=1052685 RepID=A0A8E2DM80_9APHY|nr:hypothetical protein OBBRIDRAFT_751376 [Obba rivulosa]
MRMELLTIPPDITLYILSFLSIPDLRCFSLISRDAHRFVTENEHSIYHKAAVLHKFVESETALEQALQVEQIRSGWLAGVRGWKDFCRRWYVVEKNWDCRGEVYERGYEESANEAVTCLRIDDAQRTILTAPQDGGLVVHRFEDYREVWSLSKEYVQRARFELSDGFLIFPSKQHGLEIWRRTSDASPHRGPLIIGKPVVTPVPPDSPSTVLPFQLDESKRAAAAAAESIAQNGMFEQDYLRGYFTPHAYIGKPYVHLIRFFRVRFPIAAIVSMADPFSVFIFDIGSGELLDKVKMGEGRTMGSSPAFALPPLSERVLMDLDITHTHVVLCLHAAIIIVRWRDRRGMPEEGEAEKEERPMLVLGELDLPQVLLDNSLQIHAAPYSSDNGDTATNTPAPGPGGGLRVSGREAMKPLEILPPPASVLRRNHTALIRVGAVIPPPCFVTVRFSPDGRHLAAVTAHGLFYLISDFERVERGRYFSEITQRIYMGDWLREIVWEQPRRLLLQTASEQYFLVNLDPFHHAPPPSSRPSSAKVPGFSRSSFPHMALWYVRDISADAAWRRDQGSVFSGTHMTRTAIWTVVDFKALYPNGSPPATENAPRRADGIVCHLDFTPGALD